MLLFYLRQFLPQRYNFFLKYASKEAIFILFAVIFLRGRALGTRVADFKQACLYLPTNS